MTDTASNPWWVVIAGAIPSVASGLWVWWRWRVERVDKLGEGALSREERFARDMDAQRAALTKDQRDLYDRVVADLQRERERTAALERERDEIERDRDRGWDIARAAHQRAHELRHHGLNAQHLAGALSVRADQPVPVWPDMTVKSLEEMVPRG